MCAGAVTRMSRIYPRQTSAARWAMSVFKGQPDLAMLRSMRIGPIFRQTAARRLPQCNQFAHWDVLASRL